MHTAPDRLTDMLTRLKLTAVWSAPVTVDILREWN